MGLIVIFVYLYYTIYFSLTKENNEWILDDLTESEEEKILGIYEY